VPEPATPLAERPWEDIARMLDVDTAVAEIQAVFAPTPAIERDLHDALGLVLAADLTASHAVPPFRNSAMDGYAVLACDTTGATWERPVSLPVAAQVIAGQRDVPPLSPGEAIRIMTGAPLPLGADAVVRFEETDEPRAGRSRENASVRIYRPAAALDNVREAGEDIARGTTVAVRGRELRPADLGLIASVGGSSVVVHRRPVLGILSTGNELVASGEELTPGTIHDSNSVVLAAMARSWGAEVRLLGVARDSVADLTGRLDAARDCDLIVTSGGVSLGDYDFVKDVLRSEGEIAIWQVRMKPGKPLAFGSIGGTPLLGLPGNPVAAAVSFLVFGRPAIRTMLGHVDTAPRCVDAIATVPIDNRGQRRHYVRVRLEDSDDGPPKAHVVGEQGAGVLSSLAAADALLMVPESLARVAPGTRLRAILIDR
jgi:molybdopterin molybdotransferase